jgi:hypothetical protein
MRRLLDSLALALLVCIAVRVGAWLIEPVLPLLGGLVVAAGIGWWLFSSRGSGSGGYH